MPKKELRLGNGGRRGGCILKPGGKMVERQITIEERTPKPLERFLDMRNWKNSEMNLEVFVYCEKTERLKLHCKQNTKMVEA